jgi:predicted HTH transcriptional regulator
MAFQTNAFQGTDDGLLARMRRFEDHFVERETAADKKDWLKTIVAFANSTPDNLTAVLFIGVTNAGQIETPQTNLDSLQKSLNKELDKTYPRVNCLTQVVEENGLQALAVIVPASRSKPHFAGPSFIRKMSETVEASEEQFAELIARRNSKTARLLDLKHKPITIMNSRYAGHHLMESTWGGHTTVYNCDQFYVTLTQGSDPKDRLSFSLEQVELLFDHANNRPLIKVER